MITSTATEGFAAPRLYRAGAVLAAASALAAMTAIAGAALGPYVAAAVMIIR